MLLRYTLAVLLLLATGRLLAQAPGALVPDLEALLEKKDYKAADRILKERLDHFIAGQQVDTLGSYMKYIGKVTAALQGKEKAQAAVLDFISRLKGRFPYHGDLIGVVFSAADYFGNSGNPQLAYKITKELKLYFAPRPDSLQPSLHRLESNLGSYAMGIGNYGLSSDHYRESLRLTNLLKDPDLAELFISNNSMGIAMWYASRLDSCLHYFKKAAEVLQQQDSTPLNRNFRMAMLQNNMGNVYNELGRAQDAIESFNNAIDNYQLFIASPEPHMRKEYAARARLQAIDNLAKTYNDLGDYTKGQNLLVYAYEQKVKNYGPESPEAYKSLTYLGSEYYSQRDYKKAREYLERGLQLIKAHTDEKGIWEADASTFLALVNAREGNREEAEKYFAAAEEVYKVILKEGYSAEYLQYLGEASVFYAGHQQEAKALSLTDRALRYAIANQGEQSMVGFYQLLNAAEVNYVTGNYQQTIRYSQRSLDVLKKLLTSSETLLDSILTEKQKPTAILLQVKSEYALLADKNENNLLALLNKMKEAVDVLEKRKTIFTEAKDIATLNAKYSELLDFIKLLQLELYEKTGKGAYLNDLVGLQESAVYSRIRSRLDKRRNNSFLHVPEAILREEERLKDAVSTSLQSKRGEANHLQAYLAAINQLNDFKNMLRTRYPEYYQMRYAATPAPDMGSLAQSIPADQAVVRYLFINKNLFALVLDRERQQWVSLPAPGDTDSLVALLLDAGNTPEETGRISHELYRRLWQPLEKMIRHKRVVIIPDGLLYHVSFEMLSPQLVKTFKELAEKCLLNQYAIAYHYSLLALKPSQQQKRENGNFVAFVPGFSDEEKKRYQQQMGSDTLHFDNSYLSLLPLPFTAALARKIQRRLGGSLFTSNYSTPQAFRRQAGHHSIIHIGTHAEASNISPEYSRLIFAKDPGSREEENSLYLFDIYNCDLSADLAVLTACETGKPGYQDGEGMISMAHAFNYAGSESIMTGLWKIDEQASTIISDYFYQHLQKGMTKDEALRQAKIRYLSAAQGRMLAPAYWAGLVIMGDLSPVQLQPAANRWWYWAGGAAAAGLLALFLLRRRKKKIAAV